MPRALGASRAEEDGMAGSRSRVVVSVALCVGLGACTGVKNRIQSASAGGIGAEPISIDDINAAQNSLPSGMARTDVQYAALAAWDSEQKCTAFKRRLSAGERGFDTAGDVAAGILSALGAVFTPAATVRALSAGATIVTGVKATVDADVFAKFTAPLIIQAINKTYDVDIDTQLKKLNAPGATVTVAVWLAQIAAIHDECSLDRATTYLTAQTEAKAQPDGAGTGNTGNTGAPATPPVPPAPNAPGSPVTLIRPTALPPPKPVDK
jgi:hypothetical protein